MASCMKILVTGGSGFIGSHVVDRYLALGHEVIVVDDLSTGNASNHNPKARYYRTDIRAPELAGILARERPEIVNHMAAQIDLRRSMNDPMADAQINIIGSLNLLSEARQAGVRKVIFSSSAAVYGEQTVYPADENHRLHPLTPYGIGKMTIEFYLRYFQGLYKIPYVIFRHSNVYGPRQSSQGEAGVIAIFAGKIRNGEAPVIFGDGSQTRDYVFVEDVVGCHAAALAETVQGIYHVSSGVETDLKSLAREMLRIAELKAAPRFEPPKAGDLPRSCLRPGALQDRPTPLAGGLRKTMAWFNR